MATSVSISKPQSPSHEILDAKITDFKATASYNWLDEFTPTILVPGIPPLWKPPQWPPVLKIDSGTSYIDQNADRNPGSPLETLIRAVQTVQPDFNFTEIDVVTDRRPLHRLFGFVTGELKSFKFGINRHGKTALFTRIEENTRDNEPQGYREGLERTHLKIDSVGKGSTSHHRIVCYNFGGMTLLLRFAVDAYLENLVSKVETRNADELVGYLKAMMLDEAPPSKKKTLLNSLVVLKGGRDIPYAATLELSTNRKFKKEPWTIERKMVDLWLSQTPNFVIALHESPQQGKIAGPRKAIFKDIKHIPMAEKLAQWEQDNAKALEKLAVVLKQVIDAAETLGCPCIVSYTGKEGEPLKVTKAEQDQVPGLPWKLLRVFERMENGSMTSEAMKGEEKTEKERVTESEETRKPSATM